MILNCQNVRLELTLTVRQTNSSLKIKIKSRMQFDSLKSLGQSQLG